VGPASGDQSDNPTPEPTPGRVATLRAHGTRARRALPWSDSSIFLASIVMVMILAPIWVDPSALRDLTGPPAAPTLTLPPTPVASPDVVPAVPPIGEAPATIVIRDTFERSVETGWGSADLGGSYTAEQESPDQAVSDGAGSLLLGTSGTGHDVFLGDVSVRDIDFTFSFSIDALPVDGAVYVYSALRRTDTGSAYRPKVFVTSTGALFAHSGVMLRDGEHSLGRSALVPGVIVRPGAWYNVRAVAAGSDPTVIRVRAWAAGDEEPEYWNFGVIDWTGSLQGLGSVGLAAYLGVRHPGGAITVSYDELVGTTTDLPTVGP
jgi:hypothetical protein